MSMPKRARASFPAIIKGNGNIGEESNDETKNHSRSAMGRFIKPGNASTKAETDPKKASEGGGGGSEPPTCIRSFRGFYKNYQKARDVWPETKRKLWLDTAGSIFKIIYRDEPPNESA